MVFFPTGTSIFRESTQGTVLLSGCVSSTFLRPSHSVRNPGFMPGPPQSRTFQPGAKVATSVGKFDPDLRSLLGLATRDPFAGFEVAVFG